MAFPGKMNTNT